MRIDGVTTCVGEEYAGYLGRALPVWMETLDSVVIVTDWNSNVSWLRDCPTARMWRENGRFNKGAALNAGLSGSYAPDWIVSFDCDIIPPADWRQQAEKQLQPGNLYSAKRYDEAGKQLDKRWYPRGYFQLWHASDPHYNATKPFEDHRPHAGGYDTAFANQWPQEQWGDLGFKLTHQGHKSRNWFGPGTTKEQMRQAQREARGYANYL